MVRKELLENFVLDNIIKILRKPQIMECVVNNIMQAQNNQLDNMILLNTLNKDKKQAEFALQNVMKAVEQGIINNTTNKRIKELESTIEELDKQIIIESSKTNIKISKEDIQEFYKQALLYDSFELINYVIKNIKVYEDKIEITFNSPIKISPDDNNQGFFIFSYIAKLPQYIQNKEQPNMLNIEIKLYI